ncbi:unnamed protein product [Caenorhabditis bovis]|uniref:aECM cysteine-cradle domain-containing protein n=1 Tax=Caenorhabditis bovis TaxID=2654633 RepID=A0A8S1E9U5_9PELO|nr:unnamed protein product [Caenorhabditis bovis]
MEYLKTNWLQEVELVTIPEVVTTPSTPEPAKTVAPVIEKQQPKLTTTATPKTQKLLFTLPPSQPIKQEESYLGGWNEEPNINSQLPLADKTPDADDKSFAVLPEFIDSNDEAAVREYYRNYYEDWYKRHNEAMLTARRIQIEPTTPAAPRKISIKLGQKRNIESSIDSSPVETISAATTQFGNPVSNPSKEQLDKVCTYVTSISKSFGIKDVVTFAKNNCSLIKGFHPQATCAQVQNVMEYCSTGIYVNTPSAVQ